ncbi:MAG: sulfite exporter TauE/SafE family protein [Rhodobacteraceae bacterium]|nr:sulfite exporter TauE/SafE family protein [Paracoccaceae bacterium]
MVLLAIAAGAGAVGGVLAGLLGVGGGIVIVPALYLALTGLGLDPGLTMQMAVGTSLATIVFTSVSSGLGHYRRGAIDLALLRLWAPALLVGVVGGAGLGGVVDGRVLVAVFAVVAALVAADMILRRTAPEGTPRSFSRPVWAALGVAAGGISAMMGIGGGTVCVPLLNFLGYDIRRAVGTSAAIGFVIGLPGALVYAASGWGAEGLPPFSAGYVNLAAAAVIVPLSTSFARVGVRIAHAIPRRALRLAFGLFLGLTSARMAFDLFGG